MQHRPVEDLASPFKDRSIRLTLFGMLSILAGGVCVLFGSLHILFLLLAERLSDAGMIPADAPSYVMGGLLYGLLGVAFIWVGVGSVRRRRWARPLMLALAWTWLLSGACVLLLLPGMLELVLGGPAADTPMVDPTTAGLVTTVLMLGAAVCGVVVPAVFIWIYNDRNLRMTCEAHDPRPDWTARCPPAVLGLSTGLGACAVLAVLGALRPTLPFFGLLVTGWTGGLALLLAAGLCFWLARETFALRVRGWWGTNVFLLLIGISTWVTLAQVAPDELFSALGYPQETLPSDTAAFRTLMLWMTAALTVATVAYMLAIRKHFRPPLPPQGSGGRPT